MPNRPRMQTKMPTAKAACAAVPDGIFFQVPQSSGARTGGAAEPYLSCWALTLFFPGTGPLLVNVHRPKPFSAVIAAYGCDDFPYQ